MAKTPNKHRTAWTPLQVIKLRNLAGGNTPTRLIALKLERTPEAIRSKASEKRISLRPTNQSPYDRRAN